MSAVRNNILKYVTTVVIVVSTSVTHGSDIDNETELSITIRQARCLIQHAEGYMELGFDPVILSPEDCPKIPFKEVNLSALIQNQIGSERKSRIVMKSDILCMLSYISGIEIDMSGKSEDQEIVINYTC